MLLMLPLSALVRDQPPVYYFVMAAAIFLQNLSVLLIIFTSKVVRTLRGENQLPMSGIRSQNNTNGNRSGHTPRNRWSDTGKDSSCKNESSAGNRWSETGEASTGM